MERDNFRIIKTKQELFDVKYIRKKGLKIRIEGSKLELTLLFIRDEISNIETYRILIRDHVWGEYPSMYEAVSHISSLVDKNIEEVKRRALNQMKWYTRVIKYITIKNTLEFLSYVVTFGLGAFLADLLIK